MTAPLTSKACASAAVALDAVCARGPWQGFVGRPGGTPWVLTPAEVRDLYAAIRDGDVPLAALLGVPNLSHRKADRALSLLKRAGLIAFRDGRWVCT